MQFLALEIEDFPINWKEVDSVLMEKEARRLYELQQDDLVRQVYFRADTKSAIILWECDSIERVIELSSSFPLVEAGLIHFDVIPLIPYMGFNRLFR